MKVSNRRVSQPLSFVLGVLLVLMISLLIFNLLMSPPAADFRQMGLFLSITAVISVAAGYLVYRMGWASHTPSIRWVVLGGYALSSLLTFLNVYLTARLMFASEHDLLLATVLLIFAGGIAMVLGYFLSSALTDRIQRLDKAALQISLGDLDVKVEVQGKDEVAALALRFNEMTSKLKIADQQQKELETLRSDLIAWVSHDLQTPLTSVRAILEALRDGVAEDRETQDRYLHTALRDIQSLSILIDDLFQMAQLDTGGLPLEREWGSITDLISDTLESFRQMALNKQVELEGKATPDCDPVDMDIQMIGRVLNNLVGNALRHTPVGGQVTVNARRDSDAVEVSVCDTGEGIQPNDIKRVFDRFYRGEKSRSRSTGGSGLGLAIAQGIVEAHGGRIWVESEPGEGACFYFRLPCERC